MIVLLAATPAAPAEARAAVRGAMPGDARVAEASLAVSEIVTDVLVHGRLDEHDLIELRLTHVGPTVLVEVLNDAAHGPSVGDLVDRRRFGSDAGDGGGLGQSIVGAVVADWGVANEDGRTLVWFELS